MSWQPRSVTKVDDVEHRPAAEAPSTAIARKEPAAFPQRAVARRPYPGGLAAAFGLRELAELPKRAGRVFGMKVQSASQAWEIAVGDDLEREAAICRG